MTTEFFLESQVTLIPGDCRTVIKTLADNSIDSVVTDPPYALVSIVKRFGKPGSAPVKVGNINGSNDLKAAYACSAAGFMGQQWDTGETAFTVEFWAEVFRVLKPGGHVVSFGGTRTYHRLACAIEDAGFEIRDQLAWVYGSGFPKSHDVSKGIDYRGGRQLSWFGPWLREWREMRGISQIELAKHFPSKSGGKTGRVSNFELGSRLPTAADFNLICKVLDLPFASIEEAEREVIAMKAGPPERFRSFVEQDGNKRSIFRNHITAPATDAARQWQGWGTALKPAWEPICLARKPIVGTVAENVLAHGTGALNVDGCRVVTDEDTSRVLQDIRGGNFAGGNGKGRLDRIGGGSDLGRWPANLVHDGSDEVLDLFPESNSNDTPRNRSPRVDRTQWRNGGAEYNDTTEYGDSGSAARFFYTAKADAHDRIGSKHPTVKPIDLMQWLVRLVTPKGGVCLDPFAGTGTTGEAAWREGMRCVLIEREAEYCDEVRQRMALVLHPTRRAAVVSGKGNLRGAEGTPLFGGPLAEPDTAS